MIRAIWFILRLGLLVGAVGWVMAHPGDVRIDWQDYTIETSTQFLLFFIAFIVVLFALGYRFYRAFISVPKAVRRYREVQARENGYLAITRGLAFVAAGDGSGAAKQARRAKKLLPGAPLAGLLTAQAALMTGDSAAAKLEFEHLLDDKHASFFGIRGLMKLAANENDYARLVALMRHAEKIAPKQPWIVQQLFENEATQGQWQKAEQSLSKAVRLGAVDRITGEHHRQALLLAQAMEHENQDILHSALSLAKKAYRIDPSFVPAAVFYARLLVETNKQRAAVKVVEKTWETSQHPDLQELWHAMTPALRKKDASDLDRAENRYYWVRRLFKRAPHSNASAALLGRAAMAAEKWEEARGLFKQSGDYRMLAKLELVDGGDEGKAREWLEMAADHPGKPAWVCRSCGQTGRKWQPLCRGCGAFNTAVWALSSGAGGRRAQEKTAAISAPEDGILAPPPVKNTPQSSGK